MLFQRFMASARPSLKINQVSIIMSLHKNIIITSHPRPERWRREAAKPCGEHAAAQPRGFRRTFPALPWRFLPDAALFGAGSCRCANATQRAEKTGRHVPGPGPPAPALSGMTGAGRLTRTRCHWGLGAEARQLSGQGAGDAVLLGPRSPAVKPSQPLPEGKAVDSQA